MKEEILALVVHSNEAPVEALEKVLENEMIQIDRVRTCKEASWRLASSNPPHLVFTGTNLLDGGWNEVLDLAAMATEPVSVIVLAPFSSIALYRAVMEGRAFDFITHPFTLPDLTHLVRSAVEDVSSRRKRHLSALVPVTARALGTS